MTLQSLPEKLKSYVPTAIYSANDYSSPAKIDITPAQQAVILCSMNYRLPKVVQCKPNVYPTPLTTRVLPTRIRNAVYSLNYRSSVKSLRKHLISVISAFVTRKPVSDTPVQNTQPPAAQQIDPERNLEEFFRVVEVSDGEFFAGPLFKRRFACDSFPNTPMHFVALYQNPSGKILTLGYVHFELWEQQAMGGGMVIDERAWRLLPAAERKLIRQQGGVAEMMLRGAIDLLPDNLIGIWGYVGDPLARKVDTRVGFQPTGAEHVMVIWRNEPCENGKETWIQRVVDYGPF